MKCELCHKTDAQTAIVLERDGVEDELYVCNACAKAERQRRQKQSQRTRKLKGLPPGMSMSITQVGGDGEEPPPFLGAIVDAFQDMVSGLEKAAETEAPPPETKYHDFPLSRVDAAFRIGQHLHLEGLHLIGELEAVKRALHALQMELTGIVADGVNETGHVYALKYAGTSEQARRVIEDLLREERNARVRLFEEMPRVFGDSLCRALAILKNCRLLSPGELFDLLSPLRLAAAEKMLDGIEYDEIARMQLEIDLGSSEDRMEQPERDRVDAERADEFNRRFEDVMLNERAEEKFL